MITRELWWNFEFKATYSFGGIYSYKESEVVWLLIGTILGTPVTIVLDIASLPIQIIYYICLKKIRKIRSDIK